jgi:hypothetical protein
MKLIQSLDTTGARAVETFAHEGVRYLVVPQLAADVEGQPARMTLGNSDIDTLVYRWADGQFVLHQRLPVPGGEDAEFFRIGNRAFLATASLRRGSDPYDLNTDSTIFELLQGRFVPFQQVPTFAAKQWKHFRVGQRSFLALAQGVTMEGHTPRNPAKSTLFEWTGTGFAPAQSVPSGWGYNWLAFEHDGQAFLAYADHAEGSIVLRWNGIEFEPFQQLEEKSGRAFCFIAHGGKAWLVFACLHDSTVVYAWDGTRFAHHQVLSGPGGRELHWLKREQRLVLVNFLHGSREQPLPALDSHIYRIEGDSLVLDATFPTLGGTDATSFEHEGKTVLVVAHSLSAEVRFRTASKVYLLENARPD